jgi:nicotinamidase-related amidase
MLWGAAVQAESTHEGAKPFETKRLEFGDQILWHDHCVQGTPGAELHPDLAVDFAFVILRKGSHLRSLTLHERTSAIGDRRATVETAGRFLSRRHLPRDRPF